MAEIIMNNKNMNSPICIKMEKYRFLIFVILSIAVKIDK